MKPALIIIPSINDKSLNKNAYLEACINKVIQDGYVPITPCSYSVYSHITTISYVKQVEPIVAAIYLFVDIGMDDNMKEITKEYQNSDTIWVRVERLGPEILKTFITDIYHILGEVSELSGITIEDLKSRSRKREVVITRQYYFKRSKEKTKSSLAAIGALVGKDHATVLHGIKAVENTYGMIDDYLVFFGEKKPVEKVKPEIPVVVKAKPLAPPVQHSEEKKHKPEACYLLEERCSIRPFSGYRPHSF